MGFRRGGGGGGGVEGVEGVFRMDGVTRIDCFWGGGGGATFIGGIGFLA